MLIESNQESKNHCEPEMLGPMLILKVEVSVESFMPGGTELSGIP
jgi:hypothetical protein